MPDFRNQIARDLPRFPTEVIDEWLVPIAEVLGWPPAVIPDFKPKDHWDEVLAGQPLSYYQTLAWSRESRCLTLFDYAPEVREELAEMVAGAFLERPNRYALSRPDLRQQIESVLEYLAEHHRLPVAPALQRLNRGLVILDGKNRMAAYCLAAGYFDVPLPERFLSPAPDSIDVWIARVD